MERNLPFYPPVIHIVAQILTRPHYVRLVDSAAPSLPPNVELL